MEVSIKRLTGKNGKYNRYRIIEIHVKLHIDFVGIIEDAEIAKDFDKAKILYAIVQNNNYERYVVIRKKDEKKARGIYRHEMNYVVKTSIFKPAWAWQFKVRMEELTNPISIHIVKMCPMSGESGIHHQCILIQRLESANIKYAIPSENGCHVYINNNDIDEFTNYIIKTSEQTRTVETYTP